MAIDAELKDYFRTFNNQLSDIAKGVREGGARIERLEFFVFGSKPPPPLDASAGMPPLVARVTASELEVDAAKARDIVNDARLATLENHIKAQSEAAGIVVPEVTITGEETPAPTKKEARAAYLTSRAGQSLLLKVLALVLGTVTTIMTAYIAANVAHPAALPPAPVVAPAHELAK